jgi:hypothetical protein
MKICFLCGVEAGQVFRIISPNDEENCMCADCMKDFIEYVSSGQADENRLGRDSMAVTLENLAKSMAAYEKQAITKAVPVTVNKNGDVFTKSALSHVYGYTVTPKTFRVTSV